MSCAGGGGGEGGREEERELYKQVFQKTLFWQESAVAEWIASPAHSQRAVGSNPAVGALCFLAFLCDHVVEIGVRDDRVVVAGVTGHTYSYNGRLCYGSLCNRCSC